MTSPLDLYLFSDGREVAVVYLRAFYTPDDFKSENVSLQLFDIKSHGGRVTNKLLTKWSLVFDSQFELSSCKND